MRLVLHAVQFTWLGRTTTSKRYTAEGFFVFCQKIEIYNVLISTKNGTLLMEVTLSPYPKMIKPLTFHNLFPPPRRSC